MQCVSEQNYVHLDGAQVRVLAHPLRHRILSALRDDGPSTATGVAERLGSNTGKTSYHLRILADAGLVVEEPERGNARDRWWRSAHHVTVTEPIDFVNQPEAAAALEYLMGQAARYYSAQIEQWLTSQDEWQPKWKQAAGMSDRSVRLTPERLAAMNREVQDVVERYIDDTSGDEDPHAETCTVIYTSFPNPRPVL